MKLDTEHLEILAVIVEKGGLTEGAEALGKSQPSVSRSMALLEKRVGAPLFEPRRRPLRPTELGARLARLGAQIRRAHAEAGLVVQRFQQGQAGRLRVGGTPIFMDGVVSTMIADFQARHDDVQIEQSYGYLEGLLAGLRNGTLDCAILPVSPAKLPEDALQTELLPGFNVIACRTGHPLARLKGITLADVEPYAWIAPPADSPLYSDLRRALGSIGREDIRVVFSGGTLASILSVLAGSDALTVLPYSVVFMARRTIPLEVLPLRIDHPDRQLSLLTLAGRQQPAALARFGRFLSAEFQQLRNRIEHETIALRRRG